jgi:hypothetical protein
VSPVDVGASHGPRCGQQPIIGPGQDQAAQIRSGDLAAELLHRVRDPLEITSDAALCRSGAGAAAEVVDGSVDPAERLYEVIRLVPGSGLTSM